MNIETVREAYRELLRAAAILEDASDQDLTPPDGEWSADRILGHVSIVTAATLAAVSEVAAGMHTTYDNRVAADTWTIDRVVELAGGNAGIRDRIRLQGEALCTLAGPASLSAAELDSLVPSRLLSNGTVLVDQPVPLRNLISGLAAVELPGHTAQLLSLKPA
jgi:hypothetical protein